MIIFCSDSNDYSFIAFEYLLKREDTQQVEPYFHAQNEINENMREVLVDWCIEVGLI